MSTGVPVAKGRPRLVLLGFGGATAAAECVWSLLSAGFRVAVFHRLGRRPAIRHIRGIQAFGICPPETSSRTSMLDLSALVRETGADAVLPLDDSALWLCSQALTEGIPMAGPGIEARRVALDKDAQIQLAVESGLRPPPTRVLESINDVASESWPVVVKAKSAVFESKGVLSRLPSIVCSDRAEFERLRPRWEGQVIVQPFIPGVGEGLFGHSSRDGVVAWSSHRRIRMVNPRGSGSSACQSRDVEEELAAAASDFLQKIEWRGMFMLEFLRDRNGRAWFMEMNGRAWGSMALARARGFEYPAWTVQNYFGDDLAPLFPASSPHRRARHLGMEIAHLAFVMRGSPSSALTEWPRPRRAVRDMLTIRHGDVLYNWNKAEPAVLCSDTVSTIGAYAKRFLGRVR